MFRSMKREGARKVGCIRLRKALRFEPAFGLGQSSVLATRIWDGGLRHRRRGGSTRLAANDRRGDLLRLRSGGALLQATAQHQRQRFGGDLEAEEWLGNQVTAA